MTAGRKQILLSTTDSAEAGTRPYLSESGDFRAFIAQKRTDTSRAADDLKTEIDQLEVEIQARIGRLRELDEIVARCDAALQVENVPSRPVISERVS